MQVYAAYSIHFLFLFAILKVPAKLCCRHSTIKVALKAHGTLKVQALNKISRLFVANRPHSTLAISDCAATLAQRIGCALGTGLSSASISTAFTTKSKYRLAIKNLLLAPNIFEMLKYKKAVANPCDPFASSYQNEQEKIMYFSCTKNSMPRFTDLKVQGFPAGRPGISRADSDAKTIFTNQRIEIEHDRWFYLFTNGFADQFGGLNDKKFKQKQLKSLLITIGEFKFDELTEILTEKFESWRRELEPPAEVTIIGFET